MTDLQVTLVQLVTPVDRDRSLAALKPILGDDATERLRAALSASPYNARHNGLSAARCKALLDQYNAAHEFSPTSTRRAIDYFHRYSALVPGGLTAQRLQGKSILDYGCGLSNPLAFGVLLVLNGATSVTCVDPGTFDKELSAASLKALCVEVLADPGKFDFVSAGVPVILQRFAMLDWAALYRMEIEGPVRALSTDIGAISDIFDLVFSTSVLEHVMEPEAQFERLHELTSSNAMMVHRIDFTDHRHHMANYHKFGFARDGMFKGLNGLRYVDMRLQLQASGFTIIHEDVRRDEVSDEFMASLHPLFARYSRADLTVGYVGICLERHNLRGESGRAEQMEVGKRRRWRWW